MPRKDRASHHEYRRQKYLEVQRNLLALKSQGCADCGRVYPHYMMDFDHVPERGIKRFNVANFQSMFWGSPKLMNELAKCDVVCKNCHGARTWFRGQHKRR